MRKQHLVLPTLLVGAFGSGALDRTAAAQSLSNVLGVTHIDGQYYLSSQDYLDEGTNQVIGTGSNVIKLEMNAGKYQWNSSWPSYSSLQGLASTPYFQSVFSKSSLSTYVMTAYTPVIPNTSNVDEYWLNGMSAAQKQAETTSFYNVTKYLMQTYAGTGKTFLFEQWEGDWALRDGPGSTGHHDGTIGPTQTQGMIDWINARQAGIDEARAQYAGTYHNVNVYGTLEVNRVQDAMNEGGTYTSYTVTDDVLPNTNVDYASYSSYDTMYNSTGTYSYANAVQFLANHLPASAINGQNTQSTYVGEWGIPEDTKGSASVVSTMGNVINTVNADGMPYALYWEIYSNEVKNTTTTPPPVNGNNSAVNGFWLIKPDGTPGTAWHVYRYDLATADPTQSSTAAIQHGLHLAYASNFTAPGATLGSAWTTNTSSNNMSVGISGGQLQMTTVIAATTPVGQATLNIDSVLGRGLAVGEYLQFTLNRQNAAGIIGLSAFGANHGSGIGTGVQPLNIYALNAWTPVSFNATGSGSNPTYNWDTTNTLGLRLTSADGHFATISYYINGSYSGSWMYQTTSTALDNFSLFSQSSTANASFNFNNLTIYTTNGNLAATGYKWDPGKTNAGTGGGAGTWDAGTTGNLYNGTADVTWANATLGDSISFGGTAGVVSVNAAGVIASNLIFNTAGYTVSQGPITLMGNQTIRNSTTGSVTINSILAGNAGLTIAGTGNVTLAGANTFTGGLYVSSGSALTFATDNNLGAAGQGVILDNSTLSYSGTVAGGLSETRVFTIGTNGATIQVPTAGASNGKLVINGNGLIGGSGNITKAGPGWLTLYGDNSATFTGSWNVNGGVLEAGGQTVLGSGNAVTVNSGAELALNLSSGSVANPVTVNTGAILSTDNHTANSGTFSGPIAANGSFSVRLGDFYGNFSEKVNFTGNISGAGTLTTLAPNGSNSTNTASQILTLTGNNSAFTGGITIPLGTVVAGLSKFNTLGIGPITLSGGKLALQGRLAPVGTAAAVAAVTLSGFNADTIFGNPDMSSFSTPTTGADSTFSFFQTGYTPQFNPTTTILNAATKLTGGLSGQNLTSVINSTPFALQPFMANNTLQIKEGNTGTLTLPTPTAYTSLSILATSTNAADETPGVTLHFTDGTSVTTTYKAYDWAIGTDTARQSASIFGSAGIDRYSPSTSPGWDTGAFGMYQTDLNLTNISGVDYSTRAISSITFTATTHDTLNRGITDIYAVSGDARAWSAGSSQTYSNNVSVNASAAIDVSGSLAATLGTLALGANQLSITSADTTASPYSLTFGNTTLSGSATLDVAASHGGGAGTLVLGSVSGIGSITKTDTGALTLAGSSDTITGALVINGGSVEIDGSATSASLSGNATGILTLPNGTLAVGARSGSPVPILLAGLSITGTGKLDLANNDLVVHGGNLATLTAEIKSGYNSGAFTGTGITSASAKNNSTHLTTLGILLNNNGSGSSLYTSFDSQSVSLNDVLVKYTYYGDANLDGTVNSSDYAQIDNGFNSGLTGWYNGDFNYDGMVNSSDYSLIDNAFNQSQGLGMPMALLTSQIAAPTALISSTSAAVPEPTTAVLVLACMAGMLRRRRRPVSS